MDCRNDLTVNIYFNILPEELFLPIVVGKLKRHLPAYESSNTLLKLRLVCKDLSNRVERCWQAFIDQVGHSALLLPSSLKIENGKPMSKGYVFMLNGMAMGNS